MSTKKAFVYYDDSGNPLPLRSLLLKDKAGLLPNTPMEHKGNGVYMATIGAALWAVWDTTAALPGTDTGFVIDATAGAFVEPAIPSSTTDKFLDGEKVFRNIEITDVNGLQEALAAEANERRKADASEAETRAQADTAESAAREEIENSFAVTLLDEVFVINDAVARATPGNGTRIRKVLAPPLGYRVVGLLILPAAASWQSWTGKIGIEMTLSGRFPAPTGDGWVGFWSSNDGSAMANGAIFSAASDGSKLRLFFEGLRWHVEAFAQRAIRFSVEIMEV